MAGKMTFDSNARIAFYFFLLSVTGVAPWTIDLPEVRRHLFEKHDDIMRKSKNEYDDYVNGDRSFYSNIQGNSKHNSEGHYHHDSDKYAEEFGHQSYMEKKVLEIVHDGSRYLEGLRRSLEDFNRFLEDCNRRNITSFQFPNMSITNSSWSPPLSPDVANMSMNFNTPDARFNMSPANMTGPPPGMNGNFTGMNASWMNNMTGFNMSWTNTTWMNRSSPRGMSCQEATEAREKVRRYAGLAIWATKRLQDLAYADKYQKTDKYEENELILKLAWFLDQLASLTGYEPDYKQYLPQATTFAPTPAPIRPTLVPQTQELTNFLINCVKANSSIPATIRCQYPLPIPDMVAQLLPQSQTSTQSPQADVTNVIPMSDNVPQQSLELLITSDDHRNPRKITKRSPNPEEYFVPIPIHEKPKPIVDFIVKKLTNLKAIVKSVKKHAVADFASQIAVHKHLHKRSINDNSSVLVNRLSNVSKPIVKLDTPAVAVPTIHLPVLDVSVINTKSFKKRSIDDNSMYSNMINRLSNRKLPVNSRMSNRKLIVNSRQAHIKTVSKRSADNPLTKLANYYIKYKVWDSFNTPVKNNDAITSKFDVSNHLQPKKVSKRSLFYKKHRQFQLSDLFKTMHLNKLKHKKYHSASKRKEKLLAYVNMLEKKERKFSKNRHKIIKRSLVYEHMYLPRIPTNPVGDISYYVKNKEGRNYNPSLTQAAQVRLGLEQIFQTGNIEVIHRYGSNYNPAVPWPFMAGILKGIADS